MKVKIPVSLEETVDMEALARRTGLDVDDIVARAQQLHKEALLARINRAAGFRTRYELFQALPAETRYSSRGLLLEKAQTCGDYLALVDVYKDNTDIKNAILTKALEAAATLEQVRHLRSFVMKEDELRKKIDEKCLAMEREALAKAATFAATLKAMKGCSRELDREGLCQALKLATNLKQLRTLWNFSYDDAFAVMLGAKMLEMARTFKDIADISACPHSRHPDMKALLSKALKLATGPQQFTKVLTMARGDGLKDVEREAGASLMATLTTFDLTLDVLSECIQDPWFTKLFRHALRQVATFQDAVLLAAAGEDDAQEAMAWRAALKFAQTDKELAIVYEDAPEDAISDQAFKKLAARFPKKAAESVQAKS